MSKISRFFLGVIIVGLAFIAGLRLYRVYEQYASVQEPEPSATTFNQVPISFVPQIPEQSPYRHLSSDQQKEYYLHDSSMDPETEKEQAIKTLQSITADYRDDPKLREFYADLRTATGQDISLADLSGEKLGNLMRQYPHMQEVLARHAQDPQFMKTLQEIFNNPQFVRSVEVLQGKGQNKPVLDN